MEKKQFLLGVLQLIDVAAKRGTWEGGELDAVAMLRRDVVEQLKEFADPVDNETKDQKKILIKKENTNEKLSICINTSIYNFMC